MHRNNKELIVVGDRVLVSIEEGEDRTKVGLYLPRRPWTTRPCRAGAIVAVGPGLPMPTWVSRATSRGAPARARARRASCPCRPARRLRAVLPQAAVEITFEQERYLVVPQAAILALVRDDEQTHDSIGYGL
jgi:co-chaperonin GroES (HSP10)